MKRHLLTIGIAMAAAGLISLFTARRIEAQYSSPVKVVNTTSAPALNSSVDDRGRIPYQAASGAPDANCDNIVVCSWSFPAVPAGHRLVLERVTGHVNTISATVVRVHVRNGFDDANSMAFLVNPSPTTFGPSFHELILGYLDAGSIPNVAVSVEGASFFNGGGAFSLAGYLLDCTAAPCAPIAH